MEGFEALGAPWAPLFGGFHSPGGPPCAPPVGLRCWGLGGPVLLGPLPLGLLKSESFCMQSKDLLNSGAPLEDPPT